MRCLIVDDEPRICYGLQKLIEWDKVGFPIRDTAFSAEEALAKHRKNPYSLILTDIKMQGTDGISMIHELRLFDPEAYVIIISGYDEFEYARSALQYNVSDYILKPVDERLLQKRVETIAQKLGLFPQRESGSSKASGVDFVTIQSYVDQHFTEEISLRKLSNAFFVNQAYLGRMFHERTGKKFNDYLNERRIAFVERMLRDPNCRVQDACRAAGYKDIVYFYKKFKEITGRLPSEWRSLVKK